MIRVGGGMRGPYSGGVSPLRSGDVLLPEALGGHVNVAKDGTNKCLNRGSTSHPTAGRACKNFVGLTGLKQGREGQDSSVRRFVLVKQQFRCGRKGEGVLGGPGEGVGCLIDESQNETQRFQVRVTGWTPDETKNVTASSTTTEGRPRGEKWCLDLSHVRVSGRIMSFGNRKRISHWSSSLGGFQRRKEEGKQFLLRNLFLLHGETHGV